MIKTTRFVFVCTVALLAYVPGIARAEVTPPTNLVANITSFRQINLSWAAPVSDASSYKVYLNGSVFGTTNSLSYTYLYPFLPGHQYCFTVVALDSNNTSSSPSSEACASVTQGTAPAPTGLTTTVVSSNSVQLKWQYPLTQAELDAIDEIDGLDVKSYIERSVNNGTTWSFLAERGSNFLPGDGLEITYTDTSAVPGVSNMYRVTALEIGARGFSAPSATVNANPGQTQTVPQAPSDLVVNYIGSTAEPRLTWKDNSNDETGFIVEKKVGDAWIQMSAYDYPSSAATFTLSLTNLSYSTTYTVRVRAKNSAGLSDPSNVVDITTSPSPDAPSTSSNVLCVYNSNIQISKDICDYYAQKRSGAGELGLNIPDGQFPTRDEYEGALLHEDVTGSSFDQYVIQPLTSYITASPSVQYLAIAKGVPIRLCYTPPGCGYIGSANQALNEAFNAKNITASYLTGFTLQDVKTMIDKAQASAPNLTTAKWLYDLDSPAGVNQLGDDGAAYGNTALPRYGISPQNVIIDLDDVRPLVMSTPIVAYGGLGTHHGANIFYPSSWIYDSVRIPVANRAIIDVYESFFAVSFNLRPQSQGYIAQAMSPTAFGGSNYSNSFSGGIGTVHEPGGGGTVDFGRLFEQYVKGQTLARAFKNAAGVDRYLKSMVVGDPLMTIRDSGTLLTPQDPPSDTAAPVIQSSSPDGTLPTDTTSKILSVTTNESATCKYNTSGNLAFSSSNNTTFTTTGGTTHSTTLSNLASGTSYKYYVRCQDAASNRNTSDYQVLFAIAAKTLGLDTIKPTVTINSPLARAEVSEGVITISASASDVRGIAGVTFYVNGTLVGQEDTTSPYSISGNFSPGEYNVYAIARDVANNVTTSGTISFTVKKDIVPDVTNPDVDKTIAKQPVTKSTIKPSTTKSTVNIKNPVELVYIPAPDSKIVDGQIVNDTTKASEGSLISDVGEFFVSIVDGIVDFFKSWFD